MDEAVRNLDVNKRRGPDGIDGNIVKKCTSIYRGFGWTSLADVTYWDVSQQYGK